MRRTLASCVFVSLLAAVSAAETPQPSGVIEEIRVERVLIDVIAEDADGRPMPGLVRDDFGVTLDGDAWPVETVDDLCPVAVAAPPLDLPAAASRPPAMPAGSNVVPVRFVLYFDMGQLDRPSRSRARDRALAWIARKPATAQAAVVARNGARFVEEASFTAESAPLSAAVQAAFADDSLFDPFPAQRDMRQQACATCLDNCGKAPLAALKSCAAECRSECTLAAIDEVHSVEQSAEMLKVLFTRLARIDGHKALLWFDNSSAMFPARLYAATDFDVGDTLKPGESLGSAATAARTTMWPAFSNHMQYTVNVADFTGAAHVRVGSLPDAPPCTYRLALRRRELPDGKQHRVQVDARGRVLAGNLQLFFARPADRWRAAVFAALAAPDVSRDLPVAVALVPAGLRGKKWRVQVELTVALGALDWAPAGQASRADWGAGASLSRNGGHDTWRFERFASASLPAGRDAAGFRALHRAALDVLPGTFELRGYFGDLGAQRTGGSRTALELPDPKRGGVVGPVLRASGRRHILVDLPQASRQRTGQAPTAFDSGPEPIVAGTLEPGMDVEALAFVCPGEGRVAGAITHALRVGPASHDVARALEPPPQIVHDGPCERVTARFRVPADIAPGTRIAYSLGVAAPR